MEDGGRCAGCGGRNGGVEGRTDLEAVAMGRTLARKGMLAVDVMGDGRRGAAAAKRLQQVWRSIGGLEWVGGVG